MVLNESQLWLVTSTHTELWLACVTNRIWLKWHEELPRLGCESYCSFHRGLSLELLSLEEMDISSSSSGGRGQLFLLLEEEDNYGTRTIKLPYKKFHLRNWGIQPTASTNLPSIWENVFHPSWKITFQSSLQIAIALADIVTTTSWEMPSQNQPIGSQTPHTEKLWDHRCLFLF